MSEHKHPLRCETCEYFEGHYCRKIGDRLANFEIVRIERIGCASHSSQQDGEQRPKFSSEDLILLAHDEWKRREERKHLHDEGCWIAGFLNGFCTSRRWAREQVDKIRRDAEQEREGK